MPYGCGNARFESMRITANMGLRTVAVALLTTSIGFPLHAQNNAPAGYVRYF